jgi:gliding motility-associated-like protein
MKTNITSILNKFIFTILLLVLPLFNTINAQSTITPKALPFYAICADLGVEYSVLFDYNDMPIGTTFAVELSDKTGNFSNLTAVLSPRGSGTMPSTTLAGSKVIIFQIPSTLPGSSNYKIRVRSSTGVLSANFKSAPNLSVSPPVAPSEDLQIYYKVYNKDISLSTDGLTGLTVCDGGSLTTTIIPSTGPNASPPLTPAVYDYLEYELYRSPNINETNPNPANFTLVPGSRTLSTSLDIKLPGTYYVTIYYGSGCVGSASIQAYSKLINVAPGGAGGTITGSVSGPTVVPAGASINITANTNATNPTFEWFLNGVKIVGLDPTSNIFTATQAGSYKVKITDGGVCRIFIEVPFVLTLGDPIVGGVNIPNLVSPNNDGVNDTWAIPTEYISGTNTEILLLSSTGQVVLKTNNYQNNWPDGVIDFKAVNPVYYYVITKEGQEVKKGSITLVK